MAQIVVGVLILLLSARFLYKFTETTGVFLSILLVVSGCVGYIGGTRRSANLVNLQLVVSIVGILLAFQFVGEVVRDTQVDCALAELYHRGKATERAVDMTQQAETMNAVFNRLNELEDQLTLVQAGGGTGAQLHQEQQQLRFTDFNYIRAKIEMVKRHAEEVLASVLKNDSVNADTISGMSEEDKALLRKRLDTADRVLDRIMHAHSDDGTTQLTFEEYHDILNALTDSTIIPEKASHPELQQAISELPNMNAAIQRQRADAYHTLLVGHAGAEVQKQMDSKRAAREHWAAAFQALLSRQSQRGGDYIADLPEHCVKETAGERFVVVAGLSMILLELAVTYVSLSLSFRLPTKAE